MACTLPPGAPDVRDRVQTALAGRVDWSRLSALADHHCVLPLLYKCLAEVAPGKVPEPVLAQFAMELRRNTARNLYLARVLVRLLHAFADAGIPVLPFKGPILAQQAYGNPALRVF